MPQIVAGAIVSAVGAAAGGTVAAAITVGTYATFMVAGAAVSRRQQRKAARDAASQVQDKRQTVRGSNEPHNIVVGRARVGGVQLAPGWTWGADKRNWTVPIALAGHRIAAISDVWLGEESAKPYSISTGYTESGSKWFKSRAEMRTVSIDGDDHLTSYTIAGGLSVPRVESIAHVVDGDPTDLTVVSNTLVLDVDYTIDRDGSNNLRITWITSVAGLSPLVITYPINVGDAKAQFKFFYGSTAGERDLDLETNSGGEWTATDLGKGIARVHPTLIFDNDVYPNGAQNLSCIVDGALCYDPRKDTANGYGGANPHTFANAATHEWTENPALIWAWYMTDAIGMGCPFAEINWSSVITAANVCDEMVPTDGGPDQKRYTCNGVLSTRDTIRVNVDKIVGSMLGTRFWSGGQWHVRAGAYVTPTIDFTEDDFGPGGIKILPRAKLRDLFNSVRGTFVDSHASNEIAGSAGGFWAPSDFPSYSSATYIAQDGGDALWTDLEFPLVTDWRRARRVAKVVLHRHRQALTIACTLKRRAWILQPGDTCRITSPLNGWTTKVFRVVDWRVVPHGDGVTVVLQEEASSVYDWNFSEEVTPDAAPNTALPDPRIVDPLAGFAIGDGVVDQLPDGSLRPYCLATWTAITDSAVLLGGRIEVWWKRAIDTVYRKIELRPWDTEARIEPVSGGDTINAFAWVFNGSQVRSAMAVASRSLRTDMPGGVVVPALSANLLRGATFVPSTYGLSTYVGNSTATVTLARETYFPIAGSPTNARLTIETVETGDAHVAGVRFPVVSIDPAKRYCAFAELIAWGTDAGIAVGWYDAAGGYISTSQVYAVAGNTAKRPERTEDYTLASMPLLTPPANARLASFIFFGAENWTADPQRYVWCLRPYFGVIPEGAASLPVWQPGTDGAARVVRKGRRAGPLRLSNKGASPVNVYDVFDEPGLPPGIVRIGMTGVCQVIPGTAQLAHAGAAMIVEINGVQSVVEGGRSPLASGMTQGVAVTGQVAMEHVIEVFPGGRLAVRVTGAQYATDASVADLLEVNVSVDIAIG